MGVIEMTSLHRVQLEVRQQAFFDIILVEDDRDTCEMLTECIELETPYRVFSLENAEEVLQRLQEISKVPPRLFVLDFRLPGMTGLQLYDHLHAFDAFKHVPAIIITASTLNEVIDTAIAERDLVLLLKPFDIKELLRSIELVLVGPPQLI